MDKEIRKTPEIESLYYSEFKKIRNLFREIPPTETIIYLINILHKPTKSDVEELRKYPWHILLLIIDKRTKS